MSRRYSPNRSWAQAVLWPHQMAITSARWKSATKYGLPYVPDEVVTAFGRLGHFFASGDVFGMVPDIITSAYAPLSATVLSDGISKPQCAGGMFPWLYLLRPSSVLCCGSQEHRDYQAGGYLRAFPKLGP